MTKNIFLAVGWGLAVALGIILYFEMQTIHTLTSKVGEVQATLESAQENAAQMVDLEARYKELESLVASIEATRDSAVDTANKLKEKATPPEDFDATAMVKEILGDQFKEEEHMEEGHMKPEKNIFATMFSGDKGEEMMRASLDGVVDMQYSRLYEELGLNDERREALRSVLLDHMQESSGLGMANMRGETLDMTAYSAAEADFRTSLEALLSPEELAIYDAYEEELPQHMMRQQFDMSIGMLAPGLSEASRNRTVDVLVEQLTNFETDSVTANPFSPENIEAMRARYEAAAIQLDGELDEKEAIAARRFIEQMSAGIDMMATMMGPETVEAAHEE